MPEIDGLILYKLYIEALGTELLEHILWACMASADSKIGLYEQWIDSIDNYPEMLTEAVNCFQIVIGNRSIVNAEGQSTEENASKKNSIFTDRLHGITSRVFFKGHRFSRCFLFA